MYECTDVVIIGAGVAGLAAARALGKSPLHVAVLDSQARIGGRVRAIAESDASSSTLASLIGLDAGAA